MPALRAGSGSGARRARAAAGIGIDARRLGAIAHTDLEAELTDSETSAFDALMAQATAASQADDGATAIDCFRRASEARPAAGLPQFLLGAEYAAAGEFGKAEEAFANASRLAPGFAMARYQLGLLQFSSGRPALALLTWQPLLELPESDPLPHFVSGFAALARDQFDEAIAHYRRGLERNTQNAALSGDIERVVAGIEALRGGGTAPVAAHAPAVAEVEVEAEATSHVLLSNYQQQGRVH